MNSSKARAGLHAGVTRASSVQQTLDIRQSPNAGQPSSIMESPAVMIQRIRQGDDPRLPNSHMKKVEEWNYIGPPPPGRLLELMLPLPSQKSNLGCVDEKDQATRREMDKIRNECKVWMDVFPDRILLFAFSSSSLLKGLARVQAFLLAYSQEMACRTIALVHHSATAASDSVLLKPTKELRGLNLGIHSSWRGVATDQGLVQVEQQESDDNLVPLTAQSLSLAIRQASQGVCPVLGELRVRVHFGILSLVKKKKQSGAFKPVLEEAARRGFICVRQGFGDEDLTTRILEHIYRTQVEDPVTPRFIAGDFEIEELRDVRPKYRLVFFSENCRVEVDVQREHEGPHHFTASAPRVYKSFNKSLVAEIAVACPDKKLDWHVSVESDIGADMVEQSFRNLAKALKFGDPPVNHFDCPIIHVPRAVLCAANVDNMACKVYWTFDCTKGPYCVEIAVNHEWKDGPLAERIKGARAPATFTFNTAGGTAPLPSKSCVMSLYGVEWDDKMSGINPASGRFQEQFSELFSYENDLVFGAGQLLEEVEYLLDIATAEAGGPEQP